MDSSFENYNNNAHPNRTGTSRCQQPARKRVSEHTRESLTSRRTKAKLCGIRAGAGAQVSATVTFTVRFYFKAFLLPLFTIGAVPYFLHGNQKVVEHPALDGTK